MSGAETSGASFQRERVDLCLKTHTSRLACMSVGCWYEPVLSHWVRCRVWLYIKCPGLPSAAAGWMIVLLFWGDWERSCSLPAPLLCHNEVLTFTIELNVSLPNASKQGSHLWEKSHPVTALVAKPVKKADTFYVLVLYIFNISSYWPGGEKCPQLNSI